MRNTQCWKHSSKQKGYYGIFVRRLLMPVPHSSAKTCWRMGRGKGEKREITRWPRDKRFRAETRDRLARLPVSGSASRIYHASTNLASTSSILGHLGGAWQLQYRLARREFEVAAERGGSWHANPSLKLLALSAVPHLAWWGTCPTCCDRSLT